MIVKIIKIKSGFFYNKVLVEALDLCYIIYGDKYRDKVFFINREVMCWLKISKKDCVFIEGDIIRFLDLCDVININQLPWVNRRHIKWL